MTASRTWTVLAAAVAAAAALSVLLGLSPGAYPLVGAVGAIAAFAISRRTGPPQRGQIRYWRGQRFDE